MLNKLIARELLRIAARCVAYTIGDVCLSTDVIQYGDRFIPYCDTTDIVMLPLQFLFFASKKYVFYINNCWSSGVFLAEGNNLTKIVENKNRF